MANFIQKIIEKTMPSLRVIATTLRTPQLLNSSPHTLITHTNNPIPLPDPSATENVQQAKPLQFYYPNFPFCFCLNPISATGLSENVDGGDDDEDDGGGGGDERTVWADSVKKKRKRKMNKHKYKKLRKRLRRKAR